MRARVVEGIAEGCRLAQAAALVGGETAEMPGMYADGDFDLAGFAVGAMERGTAMPAGIVPGDAILGLASDGVHSNGYSLVRRIVADTGLDWDAPAPFTDATLGQALLAPTRIYVRPLMAQRARIKGLAHITGGGLTENLPRVLPDGCGAEVALDWPLPAVFDWLIGQSGLDQAEALRTFNCGIGMTVITAPEDAEAVAAALTDAGERVQRLGTVIEGEGVTFHGHLT